MPQRFQPMIESALTEKAVTNFFNDIVAFYLIRTHWDLITKHWLKDPVKYGNAWLTVFYWCSCWCATENRDTPMTRLRVVHRLPRRIRLIAPPLVKNAEKSYLLEILLRKHAAIEAVRVVADIGSVTIQYNPTKLPEHRLLALADAVIGNLAAAPNKTAVSPAPTFRRLDGPAQECLAAVEGMTCASCAALIELSLKRDPRVENVAVNYAAETVTVRGHLSKDELFDTVAQARLPGAADGHAGAAPPDRRARKGAAGNGQKQAACSPPH